MKSPEQAWMRLVTAARRAPADARPIEVPYGFATRVAALGLAQEARLAPVFERFSLRALGVAALLALVCVAAGYSLPSGGDDEIPVEEGVAAAMDLSS